MKYITWKERWHFIVDLFKGLVLRKTDIEPFDLRKVPDEKLIKKMVRKVKKRYPAFYKALIKERNEFMAKNLYRLMTQFKEKQILAIVGAGHEKEMIRLIKKEGERKSSSDTQKKKKETS
jgi:pheromone shutdown protein TraB